MKWVEVERLKEDKQVKAAGVVDIAQQLIQLDEHPVGVAQRTGAHTNRTTLQPTGDRGIEVAGEAFDLRLVEPLFDLYDDIAANNERQGIYGGVLGNLQDLAEAVNGGGQLLEAIQANGFNDFSQYRAALNVAFGPDAELQEIVPQIFALDEAFQALQSSLSESASTAKTLAGAEFDLRAMRLKKAAAERFGFGANNDALVFAELQDQLAGLAAISEAGGFASSGAGAGAGSSGLGGAAKLPSLGSGTVSVGVDIEPIDVGSFGEVINLPSDRINIPWSRAINFTDKFGVNGERPEDWEDVVYKPQLEGMGRIGLPWSRAINFTDKFGIGGERPQAWSDVVYEPNLQSMPRIPVEWSSAIEMGDPVALAPSDVVSVPSSGNFASYWRDSLGGAVDGDGAIGGILDDFLGEVRSDRLRFLTTDFMQLPSEASFRRRYTRDLLPALDGDNGYVDVLDQHRTNVRAHKLWFLTTDFMQLPSEDSFRRRYTRSLLPAMDGDNGYVDVLDQHRTNVRAHRLNLTTYDFMMLPSEDTFRGRYLNVGGLLSRMDGDNGYVQAIEQHRDNVRAHRFNFVTGDFFTLPTEDEFADLFEGFGSSLQSAWDDSTADLAIEASLGDIITIDTDLNLNAQYLLLAAEPHIGDQIDTITRISRNLYKRSLGDFVSISADLDLSAADIAVGGIDLDLGAAVNVTYDDAFRAQFEGAIYQANVDAVNEIANLEPEFHPILNLGDVINVQAGDLADRIQEVVEAAIAEAVGGGGNTPFNPVYDMIDGSGPSLATRGA